MNADLGTERRRPIYFALAEVLGAEARLLTGDTGLARVARNILGRDRVPGLG